MVTVTALRNRIAQLNVAALSSQSVDATKDILKDQNNAQLYDGKMKDGNDIHPNYLEDPFFKTQAQAIGYAKWKRTITPGIRNFYTPNLYINGFYHSTREVKVEGDMIVYDSNASFAGSIEEKYGPGIYGLGGKYLRLYIKIDLLPEFIKRTRNELKL